MKRGTKTSLDIAKVLLTYVNGKRIVAEENNEENIVIGLTQLQLQKLVYFIEGIYLVYTDNELINEKVEAWQYGPVYPTMYTHYSKYNDKIIDYNDIKVKLDEMIELTQDEKLMKVISYVYDNYAYYTGGQLVDMTHEKGTPWEKVYNKNVPNIEIPKEKIKEYFNQQFS